MTNAEVQTGPIILPAKLRPPMTRPGAISRRDLVERLEATGPQRLRAIIAPTGWGKSELIAQWLTVHAQSIAYVRLDAKDTDPSRCWAHVLTALAEATALDVDDLVSALRAPALPIVAEIVEPLLPRLESHDVTLVLEDFSMAFAPEVNESLEALIDARPPTMGVALVSRIEPPLHLPRRRVRDELVEIRLEDLGLDVDAARRLVQEASGMAVDAELAEALHERTEGWPAGLYLAGLSLRSLDDTAGFVDRFAATDRNLSEYLASEVIARLDQDDRSFLVGTAVLRELDPDICDAVLERNDSAERLDRLSRINLFLIPVDAHRGVYRCHHLFQQWLQVELQRHGQPALAHAHRRAAEAYMSRSDRVAAAEHALEADDADLAYSSVARCGLELLDSGRHTTLSEFCHGLPEAPNADRALELALLQGWSSIVDGDLDSVERSCKRAQAALAKGSIGERLQRRSGEVSLLSAYSHLLRGSPRRCLEALVAASETGTSHRADATAEYLAACSRYWLRSLEAGADGDMLEQARRTAVEVGDPYAKLLCEAYLALHDLDSGNATTAGNWIEECLATATDHHLGGFGYLAAGVWARGRQRLAEGDLEAARADATLAVELAERRSDMLVACGARITLSEIDHSLGERSAAREHLAIADRDLSSSEPPPLVADRLAVARRQLRLQQKPTRSPRFEQPVEDLTDRETALLRLLPGELTQRELGAALHMSFNTVKTYNRQIYRKLGVGSRDGAVAAARAAGLL